MLRVKDWNSRFESAKSRDYGIKKQTYMPNKQGLGYNRMLRSVNGPALYGAWCAVIGLLSRMEKPRQGYLTDTSRSDGMILTSHDLSHLTLFPQPIIQEMLDFCRSKDIAWLEVVYVADTAKDSALPLAGDCHGPSPLPPPFPSSPPSHMPPDGWSFDQVRIASELVTVAMPPDMVQRYFDTRTSTSWVKASGIKVATTVKELHSDMRNWKIDEASRRPSNRTPVKPAGPKTTTASGVPYR